MGLGCRLCDRMMSRSAPVSPIALMFRACNCATMLLFTNPPYTIVTTFSISASVTLRPSTILVSMPSWAAICVALRPPPCTSSLLPGMLAKSFSSRSSESCSSTIFPPTLMIVSFSILSLVLVRCVIAYALFDDFYVLIDLLLTCNRFNRYRVSGFLIVWFPFYER